MIDLVGHPAATGAAAGDVAVLGGGRGARDVVDLLIKWQVSQQINYVPLASQKSCTQLNYEFGQPANACYIYLLSSPISLFCHNQVVLYTYTI